MLKTEILNLVAGTPARTTTTVQGETYCHQPQNSPENLLPLSYVTPMVDQIIRTTPETEKMTKLSITPPKTMEDEITQKSERMIKLKA